MSDNDITDTTDDSSVIQQLRAQVKRLEKEASTFRNAKLEADRNVLIEAGYEKMAPLYESELKNNPSLTAGEFLETYGLAGTAPDVDQVDGTVEETVVPDEVTGVAQQVAAVASKGGTKSVFDSLEEQLEQATSTSEVQKIMAEFQSQSNQFI